MGKFSSSRKMIFISFFLTTFCISLYGQKTINLDTIGNIIQSYISSNMIDDKSVLSVCGYKKKQT